MLVLGADERGTGGIKGKQRVGESLGNQVHDMADIAFLQKRQLGFGGEEVRAVGLGDHRVGPRPVRDRRGDHRPVRSVGEEVLAQFDHVGQVEVEVEPADQAVVDALDARSVKKIAKPVNSYTGALPLTLTR